MSGDSTVIGELYLLHYYMFPFKSKMIYSSASLTLDLMHFTKCDIIVTYS